MLLPPPWFFGQNFTFDFFHLQISALFSDSIFQFNRRKIFQFSASDWSLTAFHQTEPNVPGAYFTQWFFSLNRWVQFKTFLSSKWGLTGGRLFKPRINQTEPKRALLQIGKTSRSNCYANMTKQPQPGHCLWNNLGQGIFRSSSTD